MRFTRRRICLTLPFISTSSVSDCSGTEGQRKARRGAKRGKRYLFIVDGGGQDQACCGSACAFAGRRPAGGSAAELGVGHVSGRGRRTVQPRYLRGPDHVDAGWRLEGASTVGWRKHRGVVTGRRAAAGWWAEVGGLGRAWKGVRSDRLPRRNVTADQGTTPATILLPAVPLFAESPLRTGCCYSIQSVSGVKNVGQLLRRPGARDHGWARFNAVRVEILGASFTSPPCISASCRDSEP